MIEYEMNEFGAEVYENSNLVMQVSWDRDESDEYSNTYDLREFSVYRPDKGTNYDYGTVFLGVPYGVIDGNVERPVYYEGVFVGHARCKWLMYDVALLVERAYELR